MYSDIEYEMKETQRKLLELQVEKAVKDGELRNEYVKLRKKYNHKDTISIIADLIEVNNDIS